MNIDWGSLGLVAVVSLAAAVAVVALVSFAFVGLSAREVPVEGAARSPLSPAVGATVAAICLIATVAIVGYGLYVVIA
jgi:hypothetical protein